MIDPKEIQALRCYEGDVQNTSDPFWGDGKMYVTWNAILFDGMTTEAARCAEGRRLNPAFLEDEQRFLSLTRHLLSALHKMPKDGVRHAYRVERLADYAVMKASGILPSFISTSTGGFLDSYTDKKQLVLMEFEIMPETVWGELGVLLPAYAKAEEAEILIAPYQSITMQEEPLPAQYRNIHDACGESPAVYCKVRTGTVAERSAAQEAETSIEANKRVYEALNAHLVPEEDDVRSYLAYKAKMHNRIHRMMEEYSR